MKIHRYVAAGILALALGTGLRAEILEQVLVKVNGDIITKTDLEKLQIAALRDRPNQANPASMSDADLGKALAEVTPLVIVDAIDELLLMQRAHTLGYVVTDEQFNNVLDSIKKDNKIESEQQFQAALKQEGMTLPQLRRSLERRMLIGQVQQREVTGRIDVTDAEEKIYYDSHTSEFATTPSVTLREILVKVPTDAKGVNVAADETAQKKAETIRARLAAGEAFDKVASDASEAPSKGNGGLIGPIPKTELAEALATMLSSMKVGDVTPVVRVPNGYEILKLESSIESTTLPFENAKGQIAERLGTGRQHAELVKYLKKLRAQAIIEWKNEDIKKAYDEGLKRQAAAGTAAAAPSH
jgi:peptidyl-prolyl cis-trans isomerase SurA